LCGIFGNDLLANLHRKLIEPYPDYIEQNTRIEERDLGTHVLRDAGSGVRRDRFQMVCTWSSAISWGGQKLPSCICAIDFEACRELLDKAEIVECDGHVEKLAVSSDAPLRRRGSSE
jgi:hypothetical protein